MKETTLQPKFIKPFSRGQITLPKDYREYLRIKENSWLKIALEEDKILIEPVKEREEERTVKPRLDRKTYLKVLSKIKGAWLDEKEIKRIRKEVEKRLLKHEKDLA